MLGYRVVVAVVMDGYAYVTVTYETVSWARDLLRFHQEVAHETSAGYRLVSHYEISTPKPADGPASSWRPCASRRPAAARPRGHLRVRAPGRGFEPRLSGPKPLVLPG